MDKVIPVKVALRIRPLVSREKADACTECLRTVDSTQVLFKKIYFFKTLIYKKYIKNKGYSWQR